jgi:hypothetical protein
MQLNILVYIGVLFVVITILLDYFLVNGDKRKIEKEMVESSKKFEEDTKKDLKKIDKKMVKSKNKTLDNEIFKLDKQLMLLEKEMAKTVNKDQNKEVFHIMNNTFTNTQSKNICKALFDSELATEEQLRDSIGADWCNYGWVSNNKIFYPLDSDKNTPSCVGKKGLNGGSNIPNNNLKVGVNCYGIKPSNTHKINSIINNNYSNKELEELEEYRKKFNNGTLKIAPYNSKEWSRYSYKSDQFTIKNETGEKIVTATKTEKSNDPLSIKTEKISIDNIININ